MAIISNDKKMDIVLDNLLNRQDYLVTQANELARSFGNLSTFEHKILDYCFSFVTKDDNATKSYSIEIREIVHYLGLCISGTNYTRVANALKKLNENTALYIKVYEDGSEGILMTSLFSSIKVLKNGCIKFKFNTEIAPFIFQLKAHFYSFKLRELARVRSKYTLTLLKLWNAHSAGWIDYKAQNSLPPYLHLNGNLDEWKSWFLGYDKEKLKKWTAGRFKKDVLNVAIEEIAKLYPNINIHLTIIKNGRTVVGYTLDICPINTNLDV